MDTSICIISCNKSFNALEQNQKLTWISVPWNGFAPSHGLVAKLSFKYLASPGMTVPCERLISLPGHVVNKAVASLAPDNIDRVVLASATG